MRDQSRDNSTEAEIQALIANREFDEAIAKAWAAYGEEIVVSCRKRLSRHVYDQGADGEDVAQEVFSAFCSSLPKNYDPSQGTVLDYLFGISKNCVGNKIRTQRRIHRGFDTVLWELHHTYLRTSQPNNPEMMALVKERKERLDRAVEKVLSATEREIWKLFYHYDFSVDEIADLKGTTPGAIRTRLFRMRDKLRAKINRGEIDFTMRSFCIDETSKKDVLLRQRIAALNESRDNMHEIVEKDIQVSQVISLINAFLTFKSPTLEFTSFIGGLQG